MPFSSPTFALAPSLAFLGAQRIVPAMARSLAVLLVLLACATLQAGERRLERRLERADAMIRLGDDRGALGEFQAAMMEFPASGLPYAARASLHHQRGHSDLAAADFDRAVELAPEDPRVLQARARFRHDLGDYGGAEADLSSAIRAAPGNSDLVQRRAEVRLDSGNYPGALADAEAVYTLRPRDPEVQALRALLQVFLDQDPGMAELNRLVRSYPDNPNAYRFRANARAASGMVDGALTDLARGLQLAAPTEAPAYQERLAFMLFAAGNLPRALAIYEARAQRERLPTAVASERLARGLILRRMEQPDTANAVLREGLAAAEASPDRHADLFALIFRAALGLATERELLELVPDPLAAPEAYCLTRFYAAQIRIARDDLAGARDLLREAVLTGRRHLLEWQAARTTLEAFLPPPP